MPLLQKSGVEEAVAGTTDPKTSTAVGSLDFFKKEAEKTSEEPVEKLTRAQRSEKRKHEGESDRKKNKKAKTKAADSDNEDEDEEDNENDEEEEATKEQNEDEEEEGSCSFVFERPFSIPLKPLSWDSE